MVIESASYDSEIQAAENFLSQKLAEIQSLKSKLTGGKYIKYMVRMHTSDFHKENEHYHTQCS